MIDQARVIPVAGLAALVMLTIAVLPAVAHEEGVLTLASPTANQGSMVKVSGTDFSGSTSYRLVLQGALREYELGEVQADSAGGFSIDLQIAPTVVPGAYRVVAVAPDGDNAASVDLEIKAAPLAQPEKPSSEVGEAMERPIASADELPIERRWTGFEWFIVGAIFGGALVGGTGLMRRPGAAE